MSKNARNKTSASSPSHNVQDDIEDILSHDPDELTTRDVDFGDGIYAGDQDLVPVEQEVWDRIENIERDQGRSFFWSAGLFVEMQNGGEARPLEPNRFSRRLGDMMKWHRGLDDKTGEIKYTRPPMALITRMLAITKSESHFPVLKRVSKVPVFTPQGKLLDKPGYDDQSGLYYSPADDFQVLPIPDTISQADVAEARRFILEELIPDFPFEDESSKANAVGLLLLPFCIELIDSIMPLHSIDAPLQSSGKSLLLSTLLEPAFGRNGVPKGQAMPSTEEEFRKKITSTAVAGKSLFIMDNVKTEVNSEQLATALTGGIWEDRMMGGNQLVTCELRLIWVMTGNNPQFDSDAAERTIRIRLVPPSDNPADRPVNKYIHPDHEEWMHRERARIVRACHILIAWWIQNDRPEGSKPLSKFLRWSRTIGGILEAAGIPGFLDNYRAKRDSANTERQVRGQFCNQWYEMFDTAKVKADGNKWMLRERSATLYTFAQHIEGLPLKGLNEASQIHSLGKWLPSLLDIAVTHVEIDEEGRPLYQRIFKVSRPTISGGRAVWALEMLEETIFSRPSQSPPAPSSGRCSGCGSEFNAGACPVCDKPGEF